MSLNNWPLQRECPAFYGSPTRVHNGVPGPDPDWERKNLVIVPLPWVAHASWNVGLPIGGLRVHVKVQASLARILNALHDHAGSQAEIDRVGLSQIGGGYAWRMMRGGNALSMHSYACAVDLDPDRNGFGDPHPSFGRPENRWVVDCFAAEGWVWGGGWAKADGMHFQAARVA